MTDVQPVELGGPTNIQNAFRRLAGASEIAVQALIEVAQNGGDLARVQASRAILDRVGLSANRDVTVRVVPAEFDPNAGMNGAVAPSKVIDDRLAALRDQTVVELATEVAETAAELDIEPEDLEAADGDGEIIEAELVTE